jgi:hypothetical protein
MTLYGTQLILAKHRSRTRVRIAGEDVWTSLLVHARFLMDDVLFPTFKVSSGLLLTEL